VFGTEQKMSKCVLEIMMPISSASFMGSDKLFILGGRSSRNYHWGAPCFIFY
jgi:hypothetical protein